MEKMRSVWNGKQANEKVLYVLSGICSIIIIILASMQILGIWKNAADIFEPVLGVLMLIQAIQNWRKNKKVAIFSLCVAIFIFICAIIIFFIR